MALKLFLYQKHKERAGQTLVVLIHGLGASDTTWIGGKTTWKDLLLSDPNLLNVDVAIIKYDTAHLAMGLLKSMGVNSVNIGFLRKVSIGKGPFTDLKILAQELKRELNTNKSKEYDKIIIVGHSMGGLIGVRYILEELEHSEVLNVRGFISLATPYNGSNKALYNSLIKTIHKHAQIPSLEPNSIFLDETIRLWQKHKDQIDVRCVFCFGTNDNWVSQESSVPHIMSSKWRDSIPLPGDHSSILNVDNHSSSSYVVVSETIQNVINEENHLCRKRIEFLEQQESLSKARCIARWQASGLSRGKSLTIAQEIVYKFQKLEPTVEHPISLLIGDFGSGKSLIADLMYQNLIQIAKTNNNCPCPIFLKASLDIIGLREYVEDIIQENNDDRNSGISIIIDGMDEVGISIAAQILDEARIIVTTWKSSRITLMSRPLPLFIRLEETQYIPNLKEEEAYRLVGLVSETNITTGFSYSWPKVVKDAILRPLFAILLGLYLLEADMRVPRSKGELLINLVEKALARSEITDVNLKTMLKRLAIVSTDRGNSPVLRNEIATGDEFKQLVASGLIIETDNLISFSLPILAQWFAAQALEDNMKDITELTCDLRIMEYWTYPLIIFISLFSHDIVHDKFSLIVESNPAFASRIVEEGLANWGLSNDIIPPSALESGMRIRATMKSWVKGIGSLASLIAPVDQETEVLPIGVRISDSSVISSWYSGTECIPKINELTDDIHPLITNTINYDWLNRRMARPGRQSAWAWRWSLDDLTSRLSKLLQNRGLKVNSGPIFIEEIWQMALKLTNRGSLFSGQISVEEINEILNVRFEGLHFVSIGNKKYNLKKIREYIDHKINQNIKFIKDPWPGPDMDASSGGWVWDLYSDQRLLERTRVIYSKAIESYIQIVDEFFLNFKSRLKIYNTLPANLIGELIIPPKTHDYSSHPSLQWYFDPLPFGNTTKVEISLTSSELTSHKELNEIYDKLRHLRPKSAEWISAETHGQLLEVSHSAPVREIVYNWLWNDLKSISWVNGLLGYKID